MSDLPPNVCAVADRHGKVRYRFRRRGWKSAYLPGHPGSAEFHAAYAALLSGGPIDGAPIASAASVIPRSLDDLVRRHKETMRWSKKGARTQLVQGRILERFLDRTDQRGRRYGERPVLSVSVTWLEKILGSMAETPAAANELRKILAGALDTAIRMGWRTDNPARLTEKYKPGEGFHDWTDEEIARYRSAHALGTMARLTLELALNTAGRRCNISRVERDHLRGGRIAMAHAKGNNEASVPMLATTKAAIDALPAAPIRFLITTVHGSPFSVAGLGNRMRKWCDEAGLPQCSMHGLRKATSRLMAEGGATDAEGMAVTGQKKAATFAYYRQAADRSRLADSALSNLGPFACDQPSEDESNSDA